MHNLIELGPYGKNGEIQMVVETPRGSNIKLHYEPKLGAFTVSRALPLGLIYPYDWGFIPGTKGEDGDPIDALALHDGATYPGVVLPCHALGVVELVQEEKTQCPVQNPRLILMPVWHDRMGELERAADLSSRIKEEIEQFFTSATFFTGKKAKVMGWHGPKAADKLINASLVDKCA
jgi:inorganic pyrophosphatase